MGFYLHFFRLIQIKFFFLTFVILGSHLAHSLQFSRSGSKYDVATIVDSTICLAGAGRDSWVDGWKELLSSTHGGDVLIIRADADQGVYESWIYDDTSQFGFPKVNSVSTLVIDSIEDANNTEVESLILNSELIFFAGGDQSLYFDRFKGTRLEAAVKLKMAQGETSVAGSSAGMAILGGISYLAHYSSPSNQESGQVTSADAMKDPTATFVDLTRDFMQAPWLDGVFTESHLVQRNRMGRMMSFMARSVYNYYPSVTSESIRAIGVEINTVFCYKKNGHGKVYGRGIAVFAQGNAPIERILPNETLHWYAEKKAVKAYVISADSLENSFDLTSWEGSGGQSEYWWIDGNHPDGPLFGRTPNN